MVSKKEEVKESGKQKGRSEIKKEKVKENGKQEGRSERKW